MNWEMAKPGASGKGKCYKLHFRNPKSNVTMIELAQRIIELNLVDKVSVNPNEDGFVADVWIAENSKLRYPHSYVAKYVSKDFGKIYHI